MTGLILRLMTIGCVGSDWWNTRHVVGDSMTSSGHFMTSYRRHGDQVTLAASHAGMTTNNGSFISKHNEDYRLV